jgi:hypothetical protein
LACAPQLPAFILPGLKDSLMLPCHLTTLTTPTNSHTVDTEKETTDVLATIIFLLTNIHPEGSSQTHMLPSDPFQQKLIPMSENSHYPE